MSDKGFQKKTQAQRFAEMRERGLEDQLKYMEPSAVYDKLKAMYFVVFVLVAVGGFVLHKRRRKKKSRGLTPISRV